MRKIEQAMLSKTATAKDQLIAARALIEKPENWTKGAAARLANGRPTDADNPKAVSFCAIGALHRANTSSEAKDAIYDALYHVTDIGGSLTLYNDDDARTHEDVLRLFDVAIARV